MCIMEVRAGQKSTTIAQALAHNLSTSDRDFDMFKELLFARKDDELLVAVKHAQELTHRAYTTMLEVYGEELAVEVLHEHEHGHDAEHLDEPVGSERDHHASEATLNAVLVAAEHHDAGLARKFETR